jgi:hypothetical protein
MDLSSRRAGTLLTTLAGSPDAAPASIGRAQGSPASPSGLPWDGVRERYVKYTFRMTYQNLRGSLRVVKG